MVTCGDTGRPSFAWRSVYDSVDKHRTFAAQHTRCHCAERDAAVATNVGFTIRDRYMGGKTWFLAMKRSKIRVLFFVGRGDGLSADDSIYGCLLNNIQGRSRKKGK
jgi:hypothetical protein